MKKVMILMFLTLLSILFGGCEIKTDYKKRTKASKSSVLDQEILDQIDDIKYNINDRVEQINDRVEQIDDIVNDMISERDL